MMEALSVDTAMFMLGAAQHAGVCQDARRRGA